MFKQVKHILKFGPRAAISRIRAAVEKSRQSGHVLLLHNGRSGSTLLGNMMDQHSDVFWDGETFEKRLHKEAASRGVGIDSLYGEFTPADLTSEIFHRMDKRSGNRIFGTEIQDYHLKMVGLELPEFLAALRPKGFTKFIYLDRNYMRKVVSHIVATERNKFHIGTKTKLKKTGFELDPDMIYIGHRLTSLLEALQQYDDFASDVSKALPKKDLLHLRYEDDIENDPHQAARKVCKFLDIKFHKPKVNFGKTTTRSLKEILENYEEIEDLIRGSSFASQMTN